MKIKRCPGRLVLLLTVLLAGEGCGKNDAQSQSRAFDKAPPDIRATWELAVAADKTNDYYIASTSYAKVLAQESQLTPKQLETLEAASRGLSQRMVTAASNGDDPAKQALVRLMREQNQR